MSKASYGHPPLSGRQEISIQSWDEVLIFFVIYLRVSFCSNGATAEGMPSKSIAVCCAEAPGSLPAPWGGAIWGNRSMSTKCTASSGVRLTLRWLMALLLMATSQACLAAYCTSPKNRDRELGPIGDVRRHRLRRALGRGHDRSARAGLAWQLCPQRPVRPWYGDGDLDQQRRWRHLGLVLSTGRKTITRSSSTSPSIPRGPPALRSAHPAPTRTAVRPSSTR